MKSLRVRHGGRSALALLVGLLPSAAMAGTGPALVQEGTAQSGSTSQQVVTLPANVMAGDMLVVNAVSQTSIVTSVTGGGVAAWAPVTTLVQDGGCAGTCLNGAMWYGLNSAGGTNSVTVNFSGGYNVIVRVAEFSGIAPTAALDGFTGWAPATRTTSVAAPPLTTTASNDLVWALGASDVLGGHSGPSAGFTDAGDDSQAGFPAELGSAWTFAASPGTYSTSWTTTQTVAWVAVLAAFRTVGSDGGTVDAGPTDGGAADAGSPDGGIAEPPDGGGPVRVLEYRVGCGTDPSALGGVAALGVLLASLLRRRARR